MLRYFENRNGRALTGWPHWLEHHPVHQKGAGWIPGQDTYLGCSSILGLGCAREATNQCFSPIDVYLSLSLRPPFSPPGPLSLKINKNISLGED